MHVVLATVGTDGDVFPHIGLGSKLLDRGHRVSIAAPETYRDHISSRGLEFHSIVTTEAIQRMLSNPDLWHPLRSGPMMSRWGGSMIPQQYEVLTNLVRIQNAVLVANPGVLAARLVQEKLKCRMVSLLLQPGLIPSNSAPPEMAGGLTMPTWLPNSLRSMYWRAVDTAGYVLVAPYLNRFRSHLGLPPVRRVFQWWLSPDLVIGLFPAWYAAPQPDWPPQLRLAGFGRYDAIKGVRLNKQKINLTPFLPSRNRHRESSFDDTIIARQRAVFILQSHSAITIDPPTCSDSQTTRDGPRNSYSFPKTGKFIPQVPQFVPQVLKLISQVFTFIPQGLIFFD
jgi:UDP:flavonoid glycosyltransferase YjiC (YdhE family)